MNVSLSQSSNLDTSARNGFTLMEVLVAMTLLSVMVVVLFGTLRISAQSWDNGETKIAAVNDIAAVYNFFQRHLSAAKPLVDDFSVAGQQSFSFQGRADSLQFVGNFPASAARGGLQLFSLQWQDAEPDDPAGARINVSLTPFYPMPEGQEPPVEEVTLVNHVQRFAVAYFGSDDTGETRWQSEWLEKDSLPRLVKIEIERDNGFYWPEMVIALKVADTAGANSIEEDLDVDGEEQPEDDAEQSDEDIDDTEVME